jgi:osmotically inducible protein OsmC
MNVIYKTSATATGGRDGHSRTADGALDVRLAKPKEMGGNGQGNNPEQLFAAGYAACFLGAVKHVAGQQKVRVPDDASVTADVGIGPIEGGFGLDVELRVSLPGLPREQAEAVAQEAHAKVCPYSNATRGNIDVRLVVA